MSGVQIPLSLTDSMLEFIISLTPFKFLFIIFSSGLFISSSLVVILQNSVHSVLSLIACFFFASCFLLLLECEFFSFLFLTIYVGAIAVLFLFVVMMLNTKFIMISKRNPLKYFFFGAGLGFNFLFSIYYSIDIFFADFSVYEKAPELFVNYKVDYMIIDNLHEVAAIGQVLYTHFVAQFLISGLILLLSIIGVVSLTTDYNKKNLTKDIKQVSRKTELK